MNVTTEEILEVFEEAGQLGRRWRTPAYSIDGNLVLADSRACSSVAEPAPVPEPPRKLRTWLVTFPTYERRPGKAKQHTVAIATQPCHVSSEPCPCGGVWEWREGNRFPTHVPKMRGCKPPTKRLFPPTGKET